MNAKKKLLLSIFIILFFSAMIFMHALSKNAELWREDGQRDSFTYSISIEGLSGKKVNETTMIMVPFPTTKDGQLINSYSQKEPSLEQHILDRYILHTPDKYTKGPYFANLTEQLDNRFLSNGWTTFIVETEDGYMLKLESNESVLEDIHFTTEVVVEDIDIFDPIGRDSPILSPAFGFSETSTKPYGKQVNYNSRVNYWTYVYLSDNIEAGNKSIEVTVDAHNDPNEWEKEYRGSYIVTVWDDVEGAGKIEVEATLEQEFWFPLEGD